MRRFSLAGSLLVVLAGASCPALANAPMVENSRLPQSAPTVVADQCSPAGMQERSRRSDADSDEVSPDDADAGDQQGNDDSDNDDSDRGGAYADRGPDDAGPSDNDAGPYERGYGPDSDVDRDGPPQGYGDGDRDGPPDEDDGDDGNDDDSGIHQA